MKDWGHQKVYRGHKIKEEGWRTGYVGIGLEDRTGQDRTCTMKIQI